MNLFKNMKRRTLVIGAAAMLLVSITGAAYALYGGRSNTVTHQFSIRPGESDKKDAGTLEDKAFDPTKTVDLLPGAVITSQPSLTSNVDYDADYVIKVEQPVVKGIWYGQDGYHDPLSTYWSHDRWDYYSNYPGKAAGETSVIYYEGNEPIKPGEKISNIFDRIEVENFDKLESKFSGDIQITAYMRQHTDNSLKDHELMQNVIEGDGREYKIDTWLPDTEEP